MRDKNDFNKICKLYITIPFKQFIYNNTAFQKITKDLNNIFQIKRQICEHISNLLFKSKN